MTIVLSFTSLCLLLILGKVLRVKIKLLQKLYLPAAVIGGLAGLIIVHFTGDYLPREVTAGWDKLPGFLINICFACLFLGVRNLHGVHYRPVRRCFMDTDMVPAFPRPHTAGTGSDIRESDVSYDEIQ